MTQPTPASHSLNAPALVSAGINAVVQNASRLGISWNLLLGTVVDGTNPAAIKVTCDGDSTNVTVTSMIGALTQGDRVYVLQVPPSGLFIMGAAS